MSSGRVQPPIAAVAAVVQRLAVLLAAGVPPASAWLYVAESCPSVVPGRVATVIEDATGIPDAIIHGTQGERPLDAAAWRVVAAAWSVAAGAGSPLAPALREIAGSLRSIAQTQRDIEVALAAPVSTARIVLVLPLLGIVFGAALGFDTVGILLATPIGIACLVAGGCLILAAMTWSRRLVAAAQPGDVSAGIECELLAIAVAGGGALDRAVASVGDALDRYSIPRSGRTADALALSRRAGVPAAELLRTEAEEARREAGALAEFGAAALSVRLMLPLGLCVLPAFMILGVVPLMVSVISSTVGVF